MIGGWLSLSCPHKIVYGLKCVIRSEGPRDYVDLLLSMKHQPNVVLVDMAHMVAAHGNIRKPGMFGPYSGRIAPATLGNIQAAKEGHLHVDMPWLVDSFNNSPSSVLSTSAHPLTGIVYIALNDTL